MKRYLFALLVCSLVLTGLANAVNQTTNAAGNVFRIICT